jgi:hypothetical protein
LASITHDQLSFYFKFTVHLSQLGFIKTKSTENNSYTYVNAVTVSITSQGQIYSICFDLSEAVDELRLNNFVLRTIYYLAPKLLLIQTLLCSGSIEVLLILSHAVRSTTKLHHRILTVPYFIDDLSTKSHFSKFLFFANDFKKFCVIKFDEDYKLLQSDIDFVQEL